MAGCVLMLLAALLSLAPATNGWSHGRATYYGDEPWAWSIHQGSCGHDYLWPDQGTGWDVAALADRFPGYSGSCGRCYEVRCDASSFKDGYGQSMDRASVCNDVSASVVVKVTDTCPCDYPSNAYSNKRWCCGDKPHMDLSVWAFEKLADRRWGVIAIQYRQVDCNHRPNKFASARHGTTHGTYPTPTQVKKRGESGIDWAKHFPNGGLRSPQAGKSDKISIQNFLEEVKRG